MSSAKTFTSKGSSSAVLTGCLLLLLAACDGCRCGGVGSKPGSDSVDSGVATGARWDGPLMVVENGNAMLGRKCDPGSAREEELALPFEADLRLGCDGGCVMISGSGVEQVRFAPRGLCLQGECGSSEWGLLPQAVCADGNCELADPARAGAVAPKALVQQSLVRVVLLPVELDASACWDRPTIAAHEAEVDSAEAGREKGMPLLGCLEHAVQGASARLQVRYEATMQQNGWSQLSRYDYRIDKAPWIVGASPRGVNDPPMPLALLEDADGAARIVWVSFVGICCPSRSDAWMTRVSKEGTSQSGEIFAGGFGQPCD